MPKSKDNKRKKTKGSAKMHLYLNDLLRNEGFLKAWKKYFNACQKEKVDSKLIEELMEIEEKRKKITEKLLKQKKPVREAMHDLARQYGFDFELYIGSFSHAGKPELIGDIEEHADTCFINNRYIEFKSLDEFQDHDAVPYHWNTRWQTHAIAHPVSIDIHKYATKREVLDFIEKNWQQIEWEKYRAEGAPPPKQIRTRKLDRKITDLIWKYRDSPAKRIVTILDSEHPKHGLTYYEVKKLLDIEHQRRNEDIDLDS